MKRVDRLILGEMFSPWAFGVAIFTVLILAGSLLFEMTRYLSQGISPLVMGQLLALLMPGVLAKTFPMAVLLATLLAFGRLSGDSEIVALKAGGISVPRMMAPVAVFGFIVFLTAFFFNETLVPGASLRAMQIRVAIDDEIRGRSDRPTFYPIFEDGRLATMVVAQDFNIAQQTLRNATVVAMDEQSRPSFYLFTPEMRFTDEYQWRIKGPAKLIPVGSGITVTLTGDLFPPEVPSPDVTPETLIAQMLRDNDALSMRQIAAQIETLRENPKSRLSQVANLEFGFWNKVAVPLAALVFGLVGAPLGIRSHRAGTSTGFWMSVLIIFGYMLLANMMAIYAQGGQVPPFVASFLPIGVGLGAAIVLIRHRNRT